MAAVHEELEYDDCYGEEVVVPGTGDAAVAGSVWVAVRAALRLVALTRHLVHEFGRGVFGPAYGAWERLSSGLVGVLEGVAVDDGDEAVGGVDEDVVVVYVANESVDEGEDGGPSG